MFDLKSIKSANDKSPQNYLLEDEGLKTAIQMAIWLEKPLLLTGAPGTGKTQLAYKIAYDLTNYEANPELKNSPLCANFINEPFVFNTKTTSSATDLFYWYDAVRHFQQKYAAQLENKQYKNIEITAHSYIKLNALGNAILQTYGADEVKKNNKLTELQKLIDFDQIRPEPRSSVVLIDEIDKAPRDFPNDLLDEIDNMRFRISELANIEIEKNEANKARILIIMTSNFEKTLPPAFLRRCLFYHIPTPGVEELISIVKMRLGENPNIAKNVDSIIPSFMEIRGKLKDKEPSIAELLEWIKVLEQVGLLNDELDFKNLTDTQKNKLKFSYAALAKTENDLKTLTA